MTVKEIIKAQKICYFGIHSCEPCPFYESYDETICRQALARTTIDKLKELTELLDDKVNHHYYDTLEFYQEENAKLRKKLEAIKTISGGD